MPMLMIKIMKLLWQKMDCILSILRYPSCKMGSDRKNCGRFEFSWNKRAEFDDWWTISRVCWSVSTFLADINEMNIPNHIHVYKYSDTFFLNFWTHSVFHSLNTTVVKLWAWIIHKTRKNIKELAPSQ